jgi:lipopolysaccharide/colanic/teichoic acid biosynthesis glycosyltransferase
MRVRSPSSRASIAIHFSAFDVFLAAAAPLLALYLRNAQILFPLAADQVITYTGISFASSLIGFAVFRVYGGIPGYLSVHDVLALAKAVLLAELLICAVMFSVTRLDGVPRSVPAIHGLILGGGLFASRVVAHLADKNRKLAHRPQQFIAEHIILIGLNDLSGLFLKLIEAVGTQSRAVVGLLDENPRWIGRSLAGIPVFGPPQHLESLIDEFAVHGIGVDRVVVAGDSEMLSADALAEVRRVCTHRHVALAFIGDLFNLAAGEAVRPAAERVVLPLDRGIAVASYFRWKRLVESLVASLLIMVLMPFWLVGGLLAFIDVGSPILFWQRRIGLGGHAFQLYKIRTLHLPADRSGRLIPEDQRLSWIGSLLRQTRIDELPQLLSVLVGDMSLIGPRPLLPQDQPVDPSVRLMVRPGITGWAQVNGGSLLAPEEKEVLDAWYIRHASLWLDLRIAMMTLHSLIRGDRRAEAALDTARRYREFASAGFTATSAASPGQNDRPSPIARSA